MFIYYILFDAVIWTLLMIFFILTSAPEQKSAIIENGAKIATDLKFLPKTLEDTLTYSHRFHSSTQKFL